jgi:hypothetical protein
LSPTGRIVVTEFVRLDGVIEDPGGGEKSPYGGWAFKFERGEAGDQFKYDEYRGSCLRGLLERGPRPVAVA